MNFGVDHPKAAIVAIDLHRGHLDMAVATMPTAPDVADASHRRQQAAFRLVRAASDIPIIHLVPAIATPTKSAPTRSGARAPKTRQPPARM